MRTPRALTAGLAASALAVVAFAGPAHANPGNGWGWGQLTFDTATVAESDAIRATLLDAIPDGVTQARLDALAPLVKAGALTQDQANLIASVHNASVIAALRARGEITAATAKLVRQALAGTNGVPAKIAAANIALDRLVSSGVITAAQAAEIRGQLGLG